MKKFLAYLKHLFKDPINTAAEADARKKELMPWLYGSIGVAVGGSLLSGIGPLGFLLYVGMIGLDGAAVFGFLVFGNCDQNNTKRNHLLI